MKTLSSIFNFFLALGTLLLLIILSPWAGENEIEKELEEIHNIM